MAYLSDSFDSTLNPIWTVTQSGGASVRAGDGVLHFTDHPTPAQKYTNAQISDYDYTNFHMRWKPPLRMTVTAWTSTPAENLVGTAGFGFWNHPLSPSRFLRIPRLPRALFFFFAAPPSRLNLAYGVEGTGWLALSLDSTTPRALALTPLALPVMLLNRVPALHRRVWLPVQRALRASVQPLDSQLLPQPHTYTLEWRRDSARWLIDDTLVHETPYAPQGSMGFVAWIDNQYAVVTPQGNFAWGLTSITRAQTLSLSYVDIQML